MTKQLPEVHLIPKGDEPNHTTNILCVCKPEMSVDKKKGKLIITHNLRDTKNALEGIINLK